MANMPRMPPPKIVRGNKPQEKGEPPDPSLISKFNKPDPVKLKFDDSEIGPDPTDLEGIVCSNQLPLLVQIIEEFNIEGNDVNFKPGAIVMLHMVVEKDVVHAVDYQGLHFYLPIQAEQVYERLTVDDRVDDRLYIGVESLLKADILPPMVRVIENYYSADPTECVDEEDVLELYRVDIAPEDKRHRGRMCVYGKNQQGYDLYMHQGMTTAHFTTKISANLHPMTELIEQRFPQRVRIPSVDPNRPNIKAEKIITLIGVEKEFHVIMTTPGKVDVQVFGIPSKIPIRMKLVAGNFRHVAKALPSVYALVNPTWHVDEIGRATLPPSFKKLPQPIDEVLQPWLCTFEGKNCVKEAAKVNETDNKRQITDLKNEVDMWKNLYDTIKTSQPERPKRLDMPPPQRPPKPSAKPTSPSSNNKLGSPQPNKKDYVKLKSTPTFISKVFSKTGKDRKTPSSPKAPKPQSRALSTDYEEPMESSRKQVDADDDDDDDDDNENYEQITDEIKPVNIKQKERLERKIESQQQMIETFRKQEASLKKELREAKNKNDEHVHKIYTLQQEIESLLNKEDGIYDSITEDRPLPPPPNAMQHIYNSPSSGTSPGMKVSTEQLETFTVAGVEKFLKEIKLAKYAMTFRIENIDGPLLLALDESMVKELGLSGLDARRLFVSIGKKPDQ